MSELHTNPKREPLDNRKRERGCASTSQGTISNLNQRLLTALRHVTQLPSQCLIGLVRVYQYLISPWLGPNCRFEPSCSQYMILSVRKHGLLRGFARGIWRICRCHPFHPGGYDPP